MITGTVWGIALLLAGFLGALTGGQILLGTLFARRLDRSRAALRQRPVLATLAGLFVVGAVVLGAVVVGQVKGLQLLAAVLLIGASFGVVLGLAVVSAEVGERMASAATAPWRAILRGSVTTDLAFLLPIVGWLVIFPLAIAAGVGGLLFSASSAPAPQSESAVASA